MRSSQNRSILLAFAVAMISISACVPEFSHPLSDEKTSRIDPQLLGRWEIIDEEKDTDDKKKRTDFFILSRREGAENTLDFREERLPASGKNGSKPVIDKTNPFDIAFTTKIGSERYLTLGGVKGDQDDTIGAAKGDQNQEKAYFICRYNISKDGLLTIYLMDKDILGQDVALKKIHGIVKYSGKHKNHFDSVLITAEPSDIAKYLKTNGDECFKDDLALKLKRVGEPAP